MERRSIRKPSKPHLWGGFLPILIVLCALAWLVAIAVLCRPRVAPTVEFTPPPFDAGAVAGTPSVPEDAGYFSPYRDGMAYRFSVCGNVRTEGDLATVYLTNPSDNHVYLKLRVLDSEGQMLGETGLIRPGEYVKSVKLSPVPVAGTEIQLKIMSYHPETYMSEGSVVLRTRIGG